MEDCPTSPSPLSASSSQEDIANTDSALVSANERSETPASTMESVPLLLDEKSRQSHMISTAAIPPPPSSKRVPRLDTRSSLSGPSLPWQVDTTSSPCTPSSSYIRKPSFVPPPRPDCGTYTPQSATTPSPPHLQPDTPINPSFYRHSTSYAPGSGRFVDRSHPLGYSQDSRISFGDKLGCGNHSPFYENNRSFSLSSPITPTRRGRGILDNDPAIYLTGEGDGEDDTVWDTAAKWAKAAGKRLSQGEQQVWKFMSAIGNGGMDR